MAFRSEEAEHIRRQKISASLRGRSKSLETRAKMSVARKAVVSNPAYRATVMGQRHPGWKGDEAKYWALHERVRRRRGTPQHCEDCGKSGPGRKYEWANLTGNYADPMDYRRLCTPCHRRFDKSRRESPKK